MTSQDNVLAIPDVAGPLKVRTGSGARETVTRGNP